MFSEIAILAGDLSQISRNPEFLVVAIFSLPVRPTTYNTYRTKCTSIDDAAASHFIVFHYIQMYECVDAVGVASRKRQDDMNRSE